MPTLLQKPDALMVEPHHRKYALEYTCTRMYIGTYINMTPTVVKVNPEIYIYNIYIDR